MSTTAQDQPAVNCSAQRKLPFGSSLVNTGELKPPPLTLNVPWGSKLPPPKMLAPTKTLPSGSAATAAPAMPKKPPMESAHKTLPLEPSILQANTFCPPPNPATLVRLVL